MIKSFLNNWLIVFASLVGVCGAAFGVLMLLVTYELLGAAILLLVGSAIVAALIGSK